MRDSRTLEIKSRHLEYLASEVREQEELSIPVSKRRKFKKALELVQYFSVGLFFVSYAAWIVGCVLLMGGHHGTGMSMVLGGLGAGFACVILAVSSGRAI